MRKLMVLALSAALVGLVISVAGAPGKSPKKSCLG
jgi:hypothetical protein